jgi:ribonuclease VapC
VEVILDASAVVAIMLAEPGYERYEEAIADAPQPRISAVSLCEAGAVLLVRKGRSAVTLMLRYLEEAGGTIACFDPEDAAMAMDAYEHFGKGLSPVGLNLGDCPVHALARRHNQPVLSTSDEFARAGLKSALPRTLPT